MMTCLFLQIFCLLAYTVNVLAEIKSLNKTCNFDSSSDGPVTGTCFHVSQMPLTWQDAHRLCHVNQGWLLNCVYDDVSEFDPKVLKVMGIKSLWSGYHIKNRRLLADNFPIEDGPGNFINFSPNLTTNSRSLCVLQVYNGTCDVSERQEQSDDIKCQDSYAKVFAPCDHENLFVCIFPVNFYQSGVTQTQQGSVLTIQSENLPVGFYTTTEYTKFDDINEACNRTKVGGQAFRVSSDFERKMLLFYWNYFYSATGYTGNTTELFWLSAGDNMCNALSLDILKSDQDNTWPCSERLRVLCQWEKVYNDTPAPKLNITVNWPGVNLTGNEIQIPSRLAQQLGNPTFGYANPISKNVTIECYTRTGPLQRVMLYTNGGPVPSQKTEPGTPEFFNLAVQQPAYSSSIVPEIEFNQYFHCEVNNLKDGTILQSDLAFLRLSDYEIYSLHIDLMPSDVADKIAVVMLKASLLNQWTTQSNDVIGSPPSLNPTNTPSSSSTNGSTLADLLTSLQDVINITKLWSVKPMVFTISPPDERKTLVTYLYKKVSNTQTIANMTASRFATASKSMTELFRKNQDKLPHFNVTSVQLHSIDWCWPVTLFDNITNEEYDLPKSTFGTVWNSSNTCARDRKPLVTATCEGDKVIGLSWSSLRVNPLCDYSGNKYQRTNVTYWLQKLAQSDINTTNVEKIMNITRQIFHELDIGRFTPEDINYLADIFQKISDIRVQTPAIVQGLLDVVSSFRRFSDKVLRESQTLGNATNRILKSLDQIGGQLDFEPGKLYHRITSGGVGLEVWNLRRVNDGPLVVGIKMKSGNQTDEVTNDNLVTLFKKDQVNYGQAEVAILLEKNFINAIASKYPSSNVRLAMNVYHDTTLFKNSVVVNNSSKPSLNSRVIAAQLLLDGKPITDLDPYTVQTVFLPLKQVPTHERPGLTTCVFWDFEAESGAGGWSSEGCVYNQTIDGRDVCVCDHLTNFAVLMSFYDQESLSNENELAMTIISIVGLSLSIIGLSLSILSFILIKRLRQGRPQQTLFQLCLALLMSWVVFLAGVSQTSSHAGCIVVAVLLHYLILASFMWMLMEGILQYLLFVKVMNTYFTHYMWKTSIPAWGLPAIPVIIVLIIDTELYKGGDKYCWMSLPAFYYSFVIPVGLVILTNIVIFIMVVVSLCRREDLTKHTSLSQNQTIVNIRASFICFCVLGLSWIFGFLAIDDARIVFQYIFCISVSLQGFVMFLLMTARDNNVRAFWFSLLFSYCTRPAKKDKQKVLKSAACHLDAVRADDLKMNNSNSNLRSGDNTVSMTVSDNNISTTVSDNTVSTTVSESADAVTTPSL